MKVLFAVSNEEISESIVKKYQKEYKQIISYKNVYYFNAILKELQKDKTYDRVVISEDLEAFTHTQYDQIDKFIFEKLDSISDEASNVRGNDTPIILICSDRRTKSEPMLVKMFGIGIYNAIIGNDRSVDEVCRLINRPRTKKEAKVYYKIDTEDVNYQAENENDVSEMEIQNIVAHYKRLGKNEDRYIDSFNNIAAQYNDTQLRIITKFLPLNVRAVLEEKSPKYQQIMSFNNSVSDKLRKGNEDEEEDGPSQILLKSQNKDNILSKPVVIPSAIDMSGNRKLAKHKPNNIEQAVQPRPVMQQPKAVTPEPIMQQVKPVIKEQIAQPQQLEPKFEDFEDFEEIEEPISKPIPESIVEGLDDFETFEEKQVQEPVIEELVQNEENESIPVTPVQPVKRGRGRPRKNPIPSDEPPKPKRGRGRPRKNPLPVLEAQETIQMEENVLPGFEEVIQEPQPQIQLSASSLEFEKDNILPELEEPEEMILPGFEETSEPIMQNNFEPEPIMQNNFEPEPIMQNNFEPEPIMQNNFEPEPVMQNYVQQQPLYSNNSDNDEEDDEIYEEIDLSQLLTQDKKIASFVGTSKNGTSFIVNNIAELMSSLGVNTAILDTTQNRNSYYIYTKNEEPLREIATHSIERLSQGVAKGINVNKNLTVYTSLPDENNAVKHVDKILETLLQNHSLILIDTDFETPDRYFKQSQETYLVQSMDILTIQPLTAFLKQLKSKNILDEKKLRIVLNKVIKIKGIKDATIIGGMAFYNDPAMSFMTELFDRDRIKYVSIPFEEETYIRYLEGIIECEISSKGYSKVFTQTLKELGNMIYPMITTGTPRNNKNYQPPSVKTNGGFSSSMNSTLDKMRGY